MQWLRPPGATQAPRFATAPAWLPLLLLLQVLVRWCIQRGIPVLVKTSTLARLKENIVGMMDWRLADEHMVHLPACLRACVRVCVRTLCTVQWSCFRAALMVMPLIWLFMVSVYDAVPRCQYQEYWWPVRCACRLR